MPDPQPPAVDAYIALGANLGDREQNIQRALESLRRTPGVEVIQVSSLLENPAVGGPSDSPPFLNGAARLRTTLDAHALLARLLEIERELGRSRRQKWEPRIVDLDLLLYGSQIIREPSLSVPHPLMHERRFVLEPLAQIAPHIVHPTTGRSIAALLTSL